MYDKERIHPSYAIEHTLTLQIRFKELRVTSHATKRKIGKWLKPLVNLLKLNLDGALFFDHQKVRIGMVLLNKLGALCFAASLRIQEINKLEVVELMAILRGLQFCATWDIENLIIESDCLSMVQECNEEGSPNSRLGVIVKEIKNMRGHFGTCSIQHTLREHNVLAHKFTYIVWQVQEIVAWENILDFASVAF